MHSIVNIVRRDLYEDDEDIMFPFLRTEVTFEEQQFSFFFWSRFLEKL